MVQKFSLNDAEFTRSPGQQADIFAANIVDQRHGGPITVGYGKYSPNQELFETLAVTDVMFIVEGSLSVSTQSGIVNAGQGEIVYMPKGEAITIRSGDEGAITAYVTYPHWQEHVSEAE